MIDAIRLGMLLRVLRTDTGLPAQLIIPQVRRVHGVRPESPEAHPQVRGDGPRGLTASGNGKSHPTGPGPGLALSDGGAEPARPREPGVHAAGPAIADARKPAAAAASPRTPEAAGEPRDAGQAGRNGASAALTLSRAAQLLSVALRPPDAHAGEFAATGALTTLSVPAADAPASGATPPPATAGQTPGAAAERTRPLLPLPPASGASGTRLAAALQQGVEYSGAFYEAHLAQWFQGDRSGERLAREPQSQWPASAGEDIGTGVTATAGGAIQAGGGEPAAILRQQLDMIEGNRFVWSGELWPGQHGEFTIGEEPPGKDDSGPGWRGPPAWTSRLRLRLPGLGEVEATVVLRGTGVGFELHCIDPATGRRLATATPALRGALRNRGLELTRMKISDGKPA